MKNFAEERARGQYQIQVFDKSNDRIFKTAVENIAVESDFNAMERDGVRMSLEAGMSQIESAAAGPINGILLRGGLNGMTLEDRAALDLFVALQFVRGTAMRGTFKDLAAAVAERGRAIAAESGGVAEHGLDDADELKLAALQLIGGSLAEFAGHFHDKDLVLFRVAPSREFLLGDNPVAMQNARRFGPYGNLGLAVPGIEIYLPIGSQYCLAYWCPTILQQFRERLENAERQLAQASGLAVLAATAGVAAEAAAVIPAAEQLRDKLRRTLELHFQGDALPTEEDHVIRLNSLQVRWSERFLMSRSGNFEIAQRMIGDNAAFRFGMRPRMD